MSPGRACIVGALLSTGCASTPAPVSAAPPGALEERHSTHVDPQQWATLAHGFERSLGATPSAEQLARLGAMWHRAQQPARVDAAYQRAVTALESSGAGTHFKVVRQSQIDEVFWAGDNLGIVRRVESTDFRLHEAQRLEVWSPHDASAPLWVEYAVGTRRWFSDGSEVVYSGGNGGLVRYDLETFTTTVIWEVPGNYLAAKPAPDGATTVLYATEGGVAVTVGDQLVGTVPLDGTTHSLAQAYVTGASGCKTIALSYPTVAQAGDVSADGRIVAVVGSDDTVTIADLTHGTRARHGLPTALHGRIHSDDRQIRAVRVVPGTDAVRVVFGGGDIVTWRASTAERSAYLRSRCSPSETEAWTEASSYRFVGEDAGQSDAEACARVEQAALSPDGSLVFTGSHEGLRAVDARTGRSLLHRAGSFGHDAFGWSAQGDLFFAPIAPDEPTARWSATAGWSPFFTVPDDQHHRTTPRMFARRIDVGGLDGVIRWDMETRTGRQVRRGYGASGSHLHVLGHGAVWARETRTGLSLWANEGRELRAELHGLPSGGWITVTPDGFVDGTTDAADYLVVVVDGERPRVLPPHFLWPQRHQPGLMGELLR